VRHGPRASVFDGTLIRWTPHSTAQLPPAAGAPRWKRPRTAAQAQLSSAVTTAVTALQFQDMATQLTQHAQVRLNALERCLSALGTDFDDPLLQATRMQPVRQTQMSAGSIDLF